MPWGLNARTTLITVALLMLIAPFDWLVKVGIWVAVLVLVIVLAPALTRIEKTIALWGVVTLIILITPTNALGILITRALG